MPSVDIAELRRGVLVLDFDWCRDGLDVPLKATYPDSFPRMRPVVQVRDRGKFPRRHCSPTDGTLCLIGRDTAQWPPQMTLADLLTEQLANVLKGTGDEDPQGEPAEVWWNLTVPTNSFCLVETSWSIGNHKSGMMQVRYRASHTKEFPIIQAAVMEVRDLQRTVIATAESRPPSYLNQVITIPWIRIDSARVRAGDLNGLIAVMEEEPFLQKRGQPISVGPYNVRLFGLSYEAELQWQQVGLSWLFPIVCERKQRMPARTSACSVIRTLRSGPLDLAARAPGVAVLRHKRIGIFGAGALSSPLTIEFARNGCSRVHIVEHDTVEPGNSMRWPLGASAWGHKKLDGLSGFVESEYPWTQVIRHDHRIGAVEDEKHVGDEAVLSAVLDDIDLAIDGTASHEVTSLLSDYCRPRGIQLIELSATPSVEGGIVVRYAPKDGCPACLLHAWHKGEIARPPGFSNTVGLQQPPGCAERTFTGASYDLQELSLQAARLAVETLQNPEAAQHSVVQTLSFLDDEGHRIPPKWIVNRLPPHQECGCSTIP